MTERQKNEELENIAQNLKRLRKLRGMSQMEVAMEAGLELSYYPLLETGTQNTSIATLQKLAEVLHSSVVELVGPPKRARKSPIRQLPYRVRYEFFASKQYHPDTEQKYLAYGMIIFCTAPGDREREVDRLADITSDHDQRDSLIQLAEGMTLAQVSLLHYQDIIDDFME